jgi:hypothetical protein
MIIMKNECIYVYIYVYAMCMLLYEALWLLLMNREKGDGRNAGGAQQQAWKQSDVGSETNHVHVTVSHVVSRHVTYSPSL